MYPWCPTALIDAGHVAANPSTLRFARTGRRGFMLVAATRESFTVDYVYTPSVASRRYNPVCGASFVATGRSSDRADDGGGGGSGGNGNRSVGSRGMTLRERECPPLPSALLSLSPATAAGGRGGGGGGSSSSVLRSTTIIVAVLFGGAGFGVGWWYATTYGGGGGHGGGHGGGGVMRRRGNNNNAMRYDLFDSENGNFDGGDDGDNNDNSGGGSVEMGVRQR